MLRRFLAALVLLTIVGLLVYSVLLNPNAKASPKELNVVTKTRGYELLKAHVLGDQVTVSLKNNREQAITAFSISFGDTYTITEDFAYSEVGKGIGSAELFEKSYQLAASDLHPELPTVHLLTVLLENGSEDGDPVASQKIKDERLGEKIQILRTLRLLEKQPKLPKDLRQLKSDVAAAANAGEPETIITLNQLQPSLRERKNLSDGVRMGLQVGRDKMLQRLEALEQFPSDRRQSAFTDFKTRASELLTKL